MKRVVEPKPNLIMGAQVVDYVYALGGYLRLQVMIGKTRYDLKPNPDQGIKGMELTEARAATS